MSQIALFQADFRTVKLNAAGSAGPAYSYVRPPRSVMLSAASAHPKDILAVLNSDITIPAGESLELLGARPGPSSGTEGNEVLA